MSSYITVAQLDRMHGQKGTLVAAGGEEIVLFKRQGSVYALSNVCAHQHFSKLHEGPATECEVTCPMHGWSYDMRTGKATTGQGSVRVYPVDVVGNDVRLLIGGAE